MPGVLRDGLVREEFSYLGLGSHQLLDLTPQAGVCAAGPLQERTRNFKWPESRAPMPVMSGWCHNRAKKLKTMKKALWLQLPKSNESEVSASLEDQLNRYKRSRWISARSPRRFEQERQYRARVKVWLTLPENRWCRVYLLLLNRRVPTTQCHHYQGRRGMLLLYEPFWVPVSWEGHRWIEDHRTEARTLGLLCPLGRYNSPVSKI